MPPAGGALRLWAVLRAGVAVKPLAAGVRIFATMTEALVLDLPEDPDHASFEVYLLPAQAERFTLPKTESERHGPPTSVPGDDGDGTIRAWGAWGHPANPLSHIQAAP